MGTSATVRLIEGVRLIRRPLNTGFTVYHFLGNTRTGKLALRHFTLQPVPSTFLLRWLVGTKHFPESKTRPKNQKHILASKHFPESKNTSQNPKHFQNQKHLPVSKNTSHNPKLVPKSKTRLRIQKHVLESKNTSHKRQR